MATFNVHMLANELDYRIREVHCPAVTSDVGIDNILNEIWVQGQNDIQPQKCCSVSVGDVAEVNDRFYVILMTGFLPLNARQLLAYATTEQRDRSLYTFNEQRFLEKFPKS